MRFIDSLPYALFWAVWTAAAPLLVGLPFGATEVQLLIVVPSMGILGFFAAIITLRSKNLRWSATVGEMKSAIRAEGGAGSGAISLSVREIHEVENGGFGTHSVSFRDFQALNRPRTTRMLMIDWLTGILGWRGLSSFQRCKFCADCDTSRLAGSTYRSDSVASTPTQFDADTPSIHSSNCSWGSGGGNNSNSCLCGQRA
jgi:hypothetical protein